MCLSLISTTMFSPTEIKKHSIYNQYLYFRSQKLPKYNNISISMLRYSQLAFLEGIDKVRMQNISIAKIQISCHYYKSASEWFGKHSKQTRFLQDMQAILQNFVCFCQCPSVKHHSATECEWQLKSPISVFASSTQNWS